MLKFFEWSAARVVGALVALDSCGAFYDKTKTGKILHGMAWHIRNKGIASSNQVDFVRSVLRRYQKRLVSMQIADFPVTVPGENVELVFTMHNPRTFRVYAPLESPAMFLVRRVAGFKAGKEYSLIPFSKRNYYFLKNSGFTAGARVEEIMRRPGKPLPSPDFSLLKREPKAYQKEGIARLLALGGNAILADEQGLGKTGQAIAWAWFANVSRVCVVCPASLKFNWQREIELWTGETSSFVVLGRNHTKEQLDGIKNSKWVIINYDILAGWQAVLFHAGFDAFIFDEAQALKNRESGRSRAADFVSKKARVMLLSGTPIENRPAEFYPLVHMVDPLLFPSKIAFYRRYCDLKEGFFGLDYTGASNTGELNRVLTDTLMIRRKKDDVLKELPDKQRVVIPLKLSKRELKEYSMIENDFVEWLRVSGKQKKGKAGSNQLKAQAMVALSAMKQEVAKAKLPMVLDWIDTYLESGNKLIVFAYHKETVKAIAARFAKIAVVLDGSTLANKAQAICDSFQQEPNVRLFVGNIQAAGTGITLTAARDSLTVEFAWTSTAHDQCEARNYRIGQTKAVTAYYMCVQNTIEEKIMAVLDYKREILSRIMDGERVQSDDLLLALLKQYEGDYGEGS